MQADLHVHTFFSTGTQSPEEVVEEAASKGIGLISITDDDTMDAYAGLAELAGKYGIAFVKGVQVSAARNGSLFRLLAYDCDPENAQLQSLLQTNRAVWDHFGLQMVELWAQEFPQLSGEEYTHHRKNPAYGGFKLNSYFYHKGLDGSDGAGTKLYTQHREQVVAIMANLAFPSVEEAIQLIHDAGGYAILPGGYLRDAETAIATVDQLVATGLDGLEGYSPSLNPEMAALLREYAKEHQLLLTGGGDGHGSWASQEKYGIGIIDIDAEALNLGGIKNYK